MKKKQTHLTEKSTFQILLAEKKIVKIEFSENTKQEMAETH